METAVPCINNTSSSNLDDDHYDLDITVADLMRHEAPTHGHPFTWIAELLTTGYYDASFDDGAIEYTCEYTATDNAEIIRQAQAWYEANPEIVAERALEPLTIA